MVKDILYKMLMSGTMFLSRQKLASLLEQIASSYVRKLEADEGLRFLFDLDNRLYLLQGELSVVYGNGLHTKHQHTRYHDFFTHRVSDGARVLDVGCGNGAVAHAVAEHAGAHVVAIDLNPGNIATAQKRFAHPRVTYLVRDALESFSGEEFDVVILSNVLEHLSDRVLFLRRIQETVRPHRFLVRVPLFERDWRVPLKRELNVQWRLDPGHETEYTMESFAGEVDEAGLAIMHMEVRWGEIWSELCQR